MGKEGAKPDDRSIGRKPPTTVSSTENTTRVLMWVPLLIAAAS